LLELGTVPVLNENDAVSTRELETRDHGRAVFGDNDELSALVATKLAADLLVILSDVDGLFTANPARSSRARRIPKVVEVTPEVEALADGGGARGRGGMATKLRAAQLAAKGGVVTVIANGRTPGILDAVLAGEDVGTVFLPVRRRAGH
jgi:glutamate 5-kinase